MDTQALNLPSAGSWFHDMMGIIIIIVASLVIVGLIGWLYLARQPAKKRKRKRHSHRRKPNPTMAETGGLPPPRDPDAPRKPRL